MVGLPVWVSGVLAGGTGVNGAQAGFRGGPPTAYGPQSSLENPRVPL